eukprot:CAMPEP_0185162682 /NCGR_PEP_ID=MMETSP1139-20130426/6900_1 /TAXON_ID=298111 /ORGANISM="Pavlova sp., Strain CCMP459" /LENGTH=580 /DNA_ID=CAMNT_0027728017 /DNA_START=94 /DNA_END=1836 /DNA_ORIENTATION=+
MGSIFVVPRLRITDEVYVARPSSSWAGEATGETSPRNASAHALMAANMPGGVAGVPAEAVFRNRMRAPPTPVETLVLHSTSLPSAPAAGRAEPPSSSAVLPAPASAPSLLGNRTFVAFVHIPKMGGTTLRKLFCELRGARWTCPYGYCVNPALVISDAKKGVAPWTWGERNVFFEYHCIKDIAALGPQLATLRGPLSRRGWRVRLLSLLRPPVATTVSWYWFFARTQGPLLDLDTFAHVRPDFVLAGLFGAFNGPPGDLGAPASAAHGAWVQAHRLVALVAGASNELIAGLGVCAKPVRLAARALSVVEAGRVRSCAAGRELAPAPGACAALEAQRDAIRAQVWSQVPACATAAGGAAASPNLPSNLSHVERVLANATARYVLEYDAMLRMRDYVAAVQGAPGGCDGVNAPVHAMLHSLDHVLLTDHLREHTDRLLAALGERPVSAEELHRSPDGKGGAKGKGSGAAGARRARGMRRRLLRHELSTEQSAALASSARVLASKAPQPARMWKAEREARFVFNPSYYKETPGATLRVITANARCSLAFYDHWRAHANSTLPGTGEERATPTAMRATVAWQRT